MIKKYYLNVLILLVGIVLMGVGGVFFITAGLGGDALLVMNLGISNTLNISTGQALIFTNIITFIIILFIYRKSIGLGTIAVTFLLGLVIDLLLSFNIISQSSNFFINLIIFLLGIIIGGFGVALYIYSDLGLSPVEGLIMYVVNKSKKRFGIIKILFDMVMFTIGYLLGGIVGIGSILTVFLFGPVIDIYLVLLKKSKVITINEKEEKKEQ